jgi:ergothioneine biosynthesis protein EgtB
MQPLPNPARPARRPQARAGGAQAPDLLGRYREIRSLTTHLSSPLGPEDCLLQSMPEASPTKWHLAHTSWFFETFVLCAFSPNYQPFHPHFNYLFNSYYNAVGQRHPRPHRGQISRPSVAEVYDYRAHVDEQMEQLLQDNPSDDVSSRVLLGLHHEQQHQELLLTDIKHAFASNPLQPAYRERASARVAEPRTASTCRWLSFPGGLQEIGAAGAGFAYDNECPRHQTFLTPFCLGTQLVTNREFLAFLEDGGYQRVDLWLSDGWSTREQENWQAPLYWDKREGQWWQFTLWGRVPLVADEPVCHVSYYEADACARWMGARLPTEAEWEVVARDYPIEGNLLDTDRLHPAPGSATVEGEQNVRQLYGDVWEWTASPYTAYPGYCPPPGALGEYNGKFMVNQMVLRGGSCATPRSHLRPTYRNFFPPPARWQFSGFRVARDV